MTSERNNEETDTQRVIPVCLNDEPSDPIYMPQSELEAAIKLADGDAKELQHLIEGWARAHGQLD